MTTSSPGCFPPFLGWHSNYLSWKMVIINLGRLPELNLRNNMKIKFICHNILLLATFSLLTARIVWSNFPISRWLVTGLNNKDFIATELIKTSRCKLKWPDSWNISSLFFPVHYLLSSLQKCQCLLDSHPVRGVTEAVAALYRDSLSLSERVIRWFISTNIK